MAALLAFSMSYIVRESDPAELKNVVARDAIVAITAPSYRDGPVERTAPVVGVSINGSARAYPVSILERHEVVDDTLGGRLIAVTYSPLCAAGVVFDREVEGRVLTFKVSGRLYKNDLVMYDVETSSLWSQLEGKAIRGPLTGTTLRAIPSTSASYETFQAIYPNASLLAAPSSDTGDAVRIYAGYDMSNETLYPPVNRDALLLPKETIHGVARSGASVAYPLFRVRDSPVTNDRVGGEAIVVTWYNGAASSFEAGNGSFTWDFGFVMSDEDGRRFNMMTGVSLDGDTSLQRLASTTLYYFAWRDFHPDSTIWGGPGNGTFPESRSTLLAGQPLVVTAAVVGGVYAAARLVRHSTATPRKPRGGVVVDFVTGSRPSWLMEDGWRTTRLSILWGGLFLLGAGLTASETAPLLVTSNVVLGSLAATGLSISAIVYFREGIDVPNSRARSLRCTKDEAKRQISDVLSILGKRFVELDGVRFGGDARAIRFEVSEPDTTLHLAGRDTLELYAAPFDGKNAAFIEELEDAFHGRYPVYESIVDLDEADESGREEE
ncbi:MAG: DUF3179 domain-containing protein [Euryarchaeota archaeon]|nr:DUF3179 domain-containing protein [Euryarchaeota archaeon]